MIASGKNRRKHATFIPWFSFSPFTGTPFDRHDNLFHKGLSRTIDKHENTYVEWHYRN